VRRHLIDVGVLLVAGTAALALVVGTEPGVRSVALHVYVFAVGGLVLGVLVAGAREALPRRRSLFEQALARLSDPPAARPAQLERVEREVTLGVATAYDLHLKLLPQLREIARSRLERSGREPGPETLGRWWELLRPDRLEPEDRFGPGIPPGELRALVADLERL